MRLAELESFGRADKEDEEEVAVVVLATGVLAPPVLLSPLARRTGDPFCASPWRKALRMVKYRAEPKPVRSAEGRVPRHNARIGLEEESMVLIVGRRAAVWCDC